LPQFHGQRLGSVKVFSRVDDAGKEINPDFAVAIGQEARGAILPQQSRWVCASEPTSIGGAGEGMLSLIGNDL
jgi:hypothetical protein